MKISAVIISFNEEKHISRAIESVKWADEMILIDSGSTDRTRSIAESFGAVVLQREWHGFSAQKQFAVDQASNSLVLSLDADEEVSAELRDEIRKLADGPASGLADGYRIPRLAFYMGRPIFHSGWYPDLQLRLFFKNKGRWNGAMIHESFILDEPQNAGILKGCIYHYSVDSAAHHHKMIGERYAPLAARQMFEKGERTSRMRIATAALTTFLRAYVLKLGFLDGLAGFAIASFAAHHAFLKHLMLWELTSAKTPKEENE